MIRFVKEDLEFNSWQIASEFTTTNIKFYMYVNDSVVTTYNPKAFVQFRTKLRLEEGAYVIIQKTNKDLIIDKVKDEEVLIDWKGVIKDWNDYINNGGTDPFNNGMSWEEVDGYNADVLASKVLYNFSLMGACVYHKHVGKVCKWLPHRTAVRVGVKNQIAHMLTCDIQISLMPIFYSQKQGGQEC